MNIDPNLAVSVLGVLFVFVGVFIRLGNMKPVYWKSPRTMVGYIPLGILFILASIYDFVSKQGVYIFYAYIALIVIVAGLTIYITSRPPNFLKPTWIRWIEKHPRPIQKAMAADVGVNDQWQQNVISEAAVDAWAKQLSRKLPKNK
ncbi:MAG: hypothetical protein B6D39_07175 [Anaerolineae bacterium UTCFX2]|jgi:O-antigen/teichoic acid export membrane protein|nr:hypothetical protein [Anaerolineae bacterium]MCZ7552893.1 hypothetical protein [Anaerolineales bacterium]OQY91449.1 MAG: hypothetical protein B6D39_07175 [Anaerolineae bacterium UTCFX2]